MKCISYVCTRSQISLHFQTCQDLRKGDKQLLCTAPGFCYFSWEITTGPKPEIVCKWDLLVAAFVLPLAAEDGLEDLGLLVARLDWEKGPINDCYFVTGQRQLQLWLKIKKKKSQRNALAKWSLASSSLPLSQSEPPWAGGQNNQQMLVTLRKNVKE